MKTFGERVELEREYQRQKWGPFEKDHTLPEWSVILGKEVGEAIQAIADVEWAQADPVLRGRQSLAHELIQVSAVCKAMLEQLGVVEEAGI